MAIANRVRNDRSGFNANQARDMTQHADMNRQYKKWQSLIRKAARKGKCGIITVQYVPSEVVSQLKEAGFTVNTRRIENPSDSPSQFEKFETKIMW